MWRGRRDGNFFILYSFPGLVYYKHILRCYRKAVEVVFQKNPFIFTLLQKMK